MIIIEIIFFILTIYYVFCMLYVVVFSFAGLFYKKPYYPEAAKYRKIAILVPAYKSDNVIIQLAENVLQQDYPDFELIVIADSIEKKTLNALKEMPITVMEFADNNRTKALALNAIMGRLPNNYDIALILDSDNLIKETNYLRKINDVFDSGIKALQTHRTAKNTNTALAMLDAASEEINNHIFRRGHSTLGLSSALIGSAMAFDYSLYKEQMGHISSSGEDKELEMRLLKMKVEVVYSDNLIVLDEKTQQSKVFVNQRVRWIANQIMHAKNNLFEGFRQLFKGNFDYFDKVMQQLLLPRIFLIFSILFITFLTVIFLPFSYGLIWVIIMMMTFTGILISVPKQMYNRQLFRSLLYLPVGIILMCWSLFKIKGATKKFHATEHGIISDNSTFARDSKS